MPLPDKFANRLKALGTNRGDRPGTAATEAGKASTAPALRVVRSTNDLTPEERAFLPHLLEIEETPPSPIQRRLLWTLLALVVVG